MSILTEPHKPNEPAMWLRDMTDDELEYILIRLRQAELLFGIRKQEKQNVART